MSKKIKSGTVNDLFLIEFIAKYPIEKIKLLIEAIKNNFKEEYSNGNLISPDWKDSFKILDEIYGIIATTLFKEHNGDCFPKAVAFLDIYEIDKDPNDMNKNSDITVHDIAVQYINKSEHDRKFYKWENGRIKSWPSDPNSR